MQAKQEINLELDVKIEQGLPELSFFQHAWKSEPLTKKLPETNIPYALPLPDATMSVVAKYKDSTIGQCSTNKTLTYWTHLDSIDAAKENQSTQAFVKIHQKAVADERKYLKKINESEVDSLHSAGVAVLPEYRGVGLGFFMRKEQIKLCKKQKATTLFCETTNSFSAITAQKANFFKVAEYPYKELAQELNQPNLAEIDDIFSVWCLKL